MKKQFWSLLVFASVLTQSAVQAQSQTFTQTVGTGSNEAYLVLNFEDGPAGTNNPATDYLFGFKWDPAATPSPTGNDMLLAIQAGTNSQFKVYESVDPTYGVFVTGFSYGSITQTGASDPNGYWAYWTGPDGQTWTSASIGAGSRTLTNGSWDGWTWDSDYRNDPSTGSPGGNLLAPVTPSAAPEPSSVCVLALGATGLMLLARRRMRGADAR